MLLHGPVRGATEARIALQLAEDQLQRVGPVEDDVRVHQADEARLPGGEFVDKPVPGVIPAPGGRSATRVRGLPGAAWSRSAAKISDATATVRSVQPLARQTISQPFIARR